MPKPYELAGQRFGRLVVLRQAIARPGKGARYWVCRCDCGGMKVATSERLCTDHLCSCGCLVTETSRRNGLANRGRYLGANNPHWRGGLTNMKGTCRLCGRATWHRSVNICKPCYTNNLSGENNPYWNHFSSTNPQQGNERARRRKTLGTCEECGVRPAIDRHHVDGNTFNNDPANLRALCRRCHMIIDGRMARLHP